MKKLDIPIYIMGLVYTLILLGAGFVIGYHINIELYGDLGSRITGLESHANYLTLLTYDDPEMFCYVYNKTIDAIERETWQIGEEVQFLEENGRGSEELKARYLSYLFRDYLITKKAKATCGFKTKQLIYFYTNEEGMCDDCKEQGYELSKFRKWATSKGIDVRIYSFDGELEGVGKALKEYYTIKKYPTIIIDEQSVLEGYNTKQQISEVVGEEN